MFITQVAAAAAVAAFAGQKIEVQTARKITQRDKETGKEREAFETKMERLAPEHVLSSYEAEDGTVTVITIDGRRHQVVAAKKLAVASDKGDEK